MSPSPDEVRTQVQRLLSSKALAGSDQLQRLLRLVVDRTLSGKPELLKEYNLGLEVFHRPPDYDPKVDPIVRVQARRLRSKLDEYYATEGARDSVVIQIPKGAYVPVFGAQDLVPPPELTPIRPTPPPRRSWIVASTATLLLAIAVFAWTQRDTPGPSTDINRSVAVLPIQIFTEDGDRKHLANQVAEVLTTELAKSRELEVLSRTTASRYRDSKLSLPEIARALHVRWVVEGGLGVEGTRTYIKLRCVDSLTDRKIWADVLDCDVSDLVGVNTRAATTIAAAIAAELRSTARN
jgi:TolB-like protein